MLLRGRVPVLSLFCFANTYQAFLFSKLDASYLAIDQTKRSMKFFRPRDILWKFLLNATFILLQMEFFGPKFFEFIQGFENFGNFEGICPFSVLGQIISKHSLY